MLTRTNCTHTCITKFKLIRIQTPNTNANPEITEERRSIFFFRGKENPSTKKLFFCSLFQLHNSESCKKSQQIKKPQNIVVYNHQMIIANHSTKRIIQNQ